MSKAWRGPGDVASSKPRRCTSCQFPFWLSLALCSRLSSNCRRPSIRSVGSVAISASGGLKPGLAGLLSAEPTKSGAYGLPSKPPVPIFGAQKTGSPTHLISQT